MAQELISIVSQERLLNFYLNYVIKSLDPTILGGAGGLLKSSEDPQKLLFFNSSGAEFGVEQKFLSLYSSLTVEERFHIGHAKEDLVIFKSK